MIFHDEQNKQGLISDIDFLLFGTSDSFNDNYTMEDRTRNINLAYEEAIIQLLKADPNWQWDDKNRSKIPIADSPMESGRSQYTFPFDLTIIHRVRIKQKNGKYKTLTPVSRRDLSDSQLDSKGTPDMYYKLDNALFLVPTPNYGKDEGLEVQIQRGIEYFNIDDTDKDPGFSAHFHQYLSIGAALRYADSNNMAQKAEALRYEKEKMEREMEEFYQRRDKDRKANLRPRNKNVKHYGL